MPELLAPDEANHPAGANLGHARRVGLVPPRGVTNTGAGTTDPQPYLAPVRAGVDLSAQNGIDCATRALTSTVPSVPVSLGLRDAGYRGIGTSPTSRKSSSNARLAHGLAEVKRPAVTTRQPSRSRRVSSSWTIRRA